MHTHTLGWTANDGDALATLGWVYEDAVVEVPDTIPQGGGIRGIRRSFPSQRISVPRQQVVARAVARHRVSGGSLARLVLEEEESVIAAIISAVVH